MWDGEELPWHPRTFERIADDLIGQLVEVPEQARRLWSALEKWKGRKFSGPAGWFCILKRQALLLQEC